MKRIIIILSFLLACLSAQGQSDTLRFSVRGIVRDAETGRPIPEVAVSIPGTLYTVVTNADGIFSIKSPRPAEKLSFSLLGYVSKTEKVGEEPIMSVRLKRAAFTLDPASVMYGEPLSIMKMAIRRIEELTPDEPELQDCFYRETVRKRQRYIYVSEAVTKIYRAAGPNASWKDKVAIVKSRLLTSPKSTDTLGVKIQGGPAIGVNLDLIRTRGIILTEQNLLDYSLTMLPQESIDGRMQFVIQLTPYTDPGYALHNGIVYIDRETLAFTRIELSLDTSNPGRATRVMLVKSPTGLRFRPKEMSLTLNYKTEGGKTRLSYIRTLFRFNCDWRKRLFATEFTAKAEMVITNRHTGDEVVKINRKEAFGDYDVLADQARYFSDPEFWAAYNIIEPEESLEHGVRKLLK